MKLLSILIIALASSYSFAGHHNEAVWQAHGGKNVVNLGYSYTSISAQDKNNPSSESTSNTNRIQLNYERGFNDMLAAGIGVDYISNSSGLTNDGSGFDGAGVEHISLTFKGNNKLGFGGLYYGLNADIGFGDNKTDADGSNNASLGGIDLTPHLALVMGDRMMGYGLKLAYTVDLTKSTTNETTTPATEGETEGQNTLAIEAFFEKGLNDKSLFGVGLTYMMTEIGSDQDDNDFGLESNMFRLDLYGAVSCGVCKSGQMHFLPKVSYFMGSGEDANGGSEFELSGGSYAIEMALRKEF